MIPALVLAAAAAVAAPPGPAPEAAPAPLVFRFIGNEAWEITDGETTLLTDFPYQAGYSGYMYYTMREVKRRPNSLCLITHRHPDHFHRDNMRKVGCTVTGPQEVLDQVIGLETLPLQKPTEFRGITIHPVDTPHIGVQHYSYLVEWNGLRMYFVGDTDRYDKLLDQDDLDVLFVTPWVARDLLGAGRELPGRKKVIYHHRGRGSIRRCRECLWPRQGAEFRLAASPEPADDSTTTGGAGYDDAAENPENGDEDGSGAGSP